MQVLELVANFCGIPYDLLRDAIRAEKLDANAGSRWSYKLSKPVLDRFFKWRTTEAMGNSQNRFR